MPAAASTTSSPVSCSACLYAYLNYRGWLKRLTCVAAFIVIPVVLNGLRVYITILVSHLTDMRFGPGTEHVTFGRIFFVVVMLALFWIGRRWHDDVPVASHSEPPYKAVDSHVGSWTTWWPLALACMVALAGPPFVSASIARAQAQAADHSQLIVMPKLAADWRGPIDSAGQGWRPLYTGGVLEKHVVYDDATGIAVDCLRRGVWAGHQHRRRDDLARQHHRSGGAGQPRQ